MKEMVKRSAALFAAAVTLTGVTSAIPEQDKATAADVLKYEFEDGKNSDNDFYTEGWKGNTACGQEAAGS